MGFGKGHEKTLKGLGLAYNYFKIVKYINNEDKYNAKYPVFVQKYTYMNI